MNCDSCFFYLAIHRGQNAVRPLYYEIGIFSHTFKFATFVIQKLYQIHLNSL
jgi:hypothetical protein